jgi:HlyD family secretion protein
LARSLRRNLVVGATGIALLFGGLGGWASTTELAGAIIADGTFVVEGNVKEVQHVSGGIVEDLLVVEGQNVTAGETVVRLDATLPRASLAAISRNIDYLHARYARLEAERDGSAHVTAPPALLHRLSAEEAEETMASERRLFEDRRISREGQKARLREQAQQLREQIGGLDSQQMAKSEEIDLIAGELEGVRRLFEVGGITMSQVNALRRNAARLRGERGQLTASIASAKGRISEIELQLLQIDQTMRAEVATELRDIEREQARLLESEVAAITQLKHIEIKAPIDGVVHRLAIHTLGGVIRPADTLMAIVPDKGDLTVEARISPRDIDQISVGQEATLRLTALSRNSTPELSGSTTRISADLETDEHTGASFYRAAIAIPATERMHLGDLSLIPGMPAEIFIRTDERSVLSYFTKPILDHAAHAFREE